MLYAITVNIRPDPALLRAKQAQKGFRALISLTTIEHGRNKVTSAYIKSLQRSVEAENASSLSTSSLEKRFLEWLDSQPEISRIRPYSMVELERALNTQGRYLSPILLRRGWARRRRWSSKGSYHRYWVPPNM